MGSDGQNNILILIGVVGMFFLAKINYKKMFAIKIRLLYYMFTHRRQASTDSSQEEHRIQIKTA
jgi:hypothetical protein